MLKNVPVFFVSVFIPYYFVLTAVPGFYDTSLSPLLEFFQ